MQTAVLDIFVILPLVGSFILQSIAVFLLIRLYKESPEKFRSSVLFKITIAGTGVLVAGSLVSIVVPVLTVLALFLFFASILLLTGIIAAAREKEPVPVAETETPEEPPAAQSEEPKEDPLVAIGQSFLEHVTEALTGEINLVRLLDFINQTMIEKTGADGGVVFIADDFDDIIAAKSYSGQFPPPYKLPQDLPHKPVRVETNFRYVQFALGETIFGEVAANGKPILIEDGTKDSRIFTNGPEEFLVPGSYIAVPLIVKDRVVGVSGLARLPGKPAFTSDELRTAVILGHYSGAAINNVYCVQEVLERADLEREAGIASQIQKTLHPKRLPDLPEVGFGSFFNATKGVCGDYYDVILARRDRIALVIADVAGKGIQSSMVMMMLRSILHLVTNTTKSAGTILDWVNKGITGKIDMDHYATLSYLSYSPQDHSLEYASAGHQPMLIWRAAQGELETIQQKTDPIGVERSSVYSDFKLTVEKGDIIILFTDGLIESLNKEGRQYGTESLSQVISENNSLTAKELATEIKHNIQAFIGSASLHDDQTLVIMKIKN
jgi:sigma-B regulation protein RsbU (phosphoserine phosphatase)